VFGTIVIVFVLSLLVWPIGAFIRKRRTAAGLHEPSRVNWSNRGRRTNHRNRANRTIR
jgi:hypothetical protein